MSTTSTDITAGVMDTDTVSCEASKRYGKEVTAYYHLAMCEVQRWLERRRRRDDTD